MHQSQARKRDDKLRLAMKLASIQSQAVNASDPLQVTAERVLYHVDRLWRLVRHRQLCASRAWHVADQTVASRQAAELRELQYLVTSIDRSAPQPLPTITAGNVYRDLLGLDAEFEDCDIADDLSAVSIVSEPITLEGIGLGRFRIEINIASLARGRRGGDCLTATALDPNPAASNDEVTHPHVQGGQVCLGDGSPLFHAALKQGRLYDAFVVVTQVLKTYNEASPYISLERWNGRTCEQCDDVVREDDLYACQACDNLICSSCAQTCADCQESYCRGCLTEHDRDLICSPCQDDRERQEEEEQDEEPLTPEETDHVPATT